MAISRWLFKADFLKISIYYEVLYSKYCSKNFRNIIWFKPGNKAVREIEFNLYSTSEKTDAQTVNLNCP